MGECIAALDLHSFTFLSNDTVVSEFFFENSKENICEIEIIFEKTYACQSGT